MSESKDKHGLSACLPAAPVIDVDGNAQAAAEELNSPMKDKLDDWLCLLMDKQLSPLEMV